MSVAVAEERRWGPGRRWTWVAIIFVIQLVLIFTLSDRAPVQPRPPSTPPGFRLLQHPRGELLALHDPTLFALPHAEGFSGLAWLETPRHTSQVREWNEPTQWLAMALQPLAGSIKNLRPSNMGGPPSLATGMEPQLTTPDSGPAVVSSARSAVRIEGALSSRLLQTPLELRAWPAPDLLTNTIIQAAVDAAGRPVSLLLATRSGSREADSFALEQVRRARFEPAKLPGGVSDAPPLTRGDVIFDWQTLPITNSTPAGNPDRR